MGALSVKCPKEIMNYEEKVVFGFSMRKMLYISCGFVLLIIVTSIGFVAKFPQIITTVLAICVVIPPYLLGFYKKNGFDFIDYIKIVISHKMRKNKLTRVTVTVHEYLTEGKTGERKEENVHKKKKRRYQINEIDGTTKTKGIFKKRN